MKRIAVCGEVFSSNLGDGVIFESIKYLLSKNNIEAVPIDLSGRNYYKNEKNSNDYNSNSIRKRLQPLIRSSSTLRRSYAMLKWYSLSKKKYIKHWEDVILSCDAVIIGGGQLFTDIDFGFPPKVYEIYNISKRFDKPLAIYGCGVDEPWGLFAKYMYEKILGYAKYISVRDYYSQNIFLKSSVSCITVNVHPDPGFMSGQVYNEHVQKSSTDTIGFNIQPVSHFRAFVPSLKKITNEEYVNFWVQLIKGAYYGGKTPIILTNGDEDDFKQAQFISSELSKQGVQIKVLERAISPIQLINQLRDIPILISTRMHAGIIAYGFGSEVLAICWDKKVKNVWATIQEEKNVINANVLLRTSPWPYFHSLMKQQNLKDDNQLVSIHESICLSMNNCLISLGML